MLGWYYEFHSLIIPKCSIIDSRVSKHCYVATSSKKIKDCLGKMLCLEMPFSCMTYQCLSHKCIVGRWLRYYVEWIAKGRFDCNVSFLPAQWRRLIAA